MNWIGELFIRHEDKKQTEARIKLEIAKKLQNMIDDTNNSPAAFIESAVILIGIEIPDFIAELETSANA